MSPERHPCPCCGFRTYGKPAGGTMQLCPVCAWEDAAGEYRYSGSNQLTLLEAQRHFMAHGACEEEFLSVVRSPLPEEARSGHWASFDELCLRIIANIEMEFRDVRREGGFTLHQMDLIDDYHLPGSPEVIKAELKDPEVRWQDIRPDKLSMFHRFLIFLDDFGYRFYLPAFMTHAILTSQPDIEMAEIDGVLFSLDRGPEDYYRSESFDRLSPRQKQAVASFLFLFATYDKDCNGRDALKGLKKGWDVFVPDFLKLALL